MVHLPILRAGRSYCSLDVVRLTDISSGEPVADVSQANRGLIARDLQRKGDNRNRLAKIPFAELLSICRRAARLFAQGELPIDGGTTQSAEQYIGQLSATTGMPQTLARSNMEKIRFVLDSMDRVLRGLTRGLDLDILDGGWGDEADRTVSYLGEANVLGAVLPNNSPGVHSLWIPSIALRVPVVLKPGRQEPWTPFRIARALQEAGCPMEAVSFYPSDHAGAAEILLRSCRSMLFGDAATLDAWRDDQRVQLHGPGWSKVLIGADCIDRWEEYIDLIVGSIADNGGRSCVNASGVWVPSRGREVADTLAARLAAIPARPLNHPQARLAAFSSPRQAHGISAYIDRMLAIPGAEDVTGRLRGGDRVVEVGGCTFLLPTVIRCDDPEHPLAASEFLFPFATVVEVPQDELPDRIGSTLVASVLSDDGRLRSALLGSPDIDRLNLGPIATNSVCWDQPHEGNLFEHLYRQRALQSAAMTDPAVHVDPAGAPGGGS
jgi:acyl-CoA reductase-like NAD-dependent aldehyde dehydrogenase